MDKETLNIIRNNPIIYSYLREESQEYEYLLKDKNYLKKIESKAKEKYKKTLSHKLNKLAKRLELLNELMDVLN